MKKRHTQAKSRLIALARTNGDIKQVRIKDFGGSYSKLAHEMHELENQGYYTFDGTTVKLTKKGKDYLMKVNRFK